MPGRFSRKSPAGKPVTGARLVELIGVGIGIKLVEGQVCHGAGEAGKTEPGGKLPSEAERQSMESNSVFGNVEPFAPNG